MHIRVALTNIQVELMAITATVPLPKGQKATSSFGNRGFNDEVKHAPSRKRESPSSLSKARQP